jgi:TPR repeat protein
VPQNYAEAVKWFRLAADQGNLDAQLNLGRKYTFGVGVPQNHAEAFKWFRLAADRGIAVA